MNRGTVSDPMLLPLGGQNTIPSSNMGWFTPYFLAHHALRFAPDKPCVIHLADQLRVELVLVRAKAHDDIAQPWNEVSLAAAMVLQFKVLIEGIMHGRITILFKDHDRRLIPQLMIEPQTVDGNLLGKEWHAINRTVAWRMNMVIQDSEMIV